jgi:hypothetical protein
MISTHELPSGRTYWTVDRPSRYDQGHAEDVPPAAIVAGATALGALPIFIIGAAAANANAGNIGTELWVFTALAGATIIGGVALALGVVARSERRWQARDSS